MKKMLSFITSILMVSSMTSSVVYAEGTHLPGGGYIPEGMEVAETPEAPDIVRESVSAELTEQLKAIYEQLQPFDNAQSTIFFNEGINNNILFTSTDQETIDKVKQFIANNGIDENLVLVDLMVNEVMFDTTVTTSSANIPNGIPTDTTTTSPDIVREPVSAELTGQLKAIYEQLKPFDDAQSTIFFNEGINDKILFTSVNQETVDKVKQFIADNGIDENLVLVDLEVPEDALVTTIITTDKSVTTTTSTTSDTSENRVDLRDFYEEIKEYSEEASAKYRKMTVDEVYKDILGNYVMLSAESENLRDHLLVMDENAKLHGMIKIQTETCVKVKSGTELPDIPSSVRYWVNEDVYILKSDDMNEVNKYVGSIKNNENVLAIDNHYGVYEDTVNDFRIEGFRYDGDELTEEFFAAYPHLGLKTNESDTKDNRHSIYCKIDKNAEPSDIFDEMVSLKKAVSGIEPVFTQTEVALITPVMYYCSYCNAPMLINGLDGDANIDGDMDIADAVMIMQSLANPDKYGVNKEKGITYQGIKNADTNKDGITNIDALNIQRKLLKLD